MTGVGRDPSAIAQREGAVNVIRAVRSKVLVAVNVLEDTFELPPVFRAKFDRGAVGHADGAAAHGEVLGFNGSRKGDKSNKSCKKKGCERFHFFEFFERRSVEAHFLRFL